MKTLFSQRWGVAYFKNNGSSFMFKLFLFYYMYFEENKCIISLIMQRTPIHHIVCDISWKKSFICVAQALLLSMAGQGCHQHRACCDVSVNNQMVPDLVLLTPLLGLFVVYTNDWSDGRRQLIEKWRQMRGRRRENGPAVFVVTSHKVVTSRGYLPYRDP